MAPKNPTKSEPSKDGNKSPKTRKGVAKPVKKTDPRKKGVTTKFKELSDDYTKWNVPQLKDKCRVYGEKIGGKKAEIVQRLQAYDQKNGTDPNSTGDDAEDDTEDDDQSAEGSDETKVQGKPLHLLPRGSTEEPDERQVQGKPTHGPGKALADVEDLIARSGKKSISEPPKLKATRKEIARAKGYLAQTLDILNQVKKENSGDEEVFWEVIEHLNGAITEFESIIHGGEAVEEPAEEDEPTSEHAATESDEDDESSNKQGSDDSSSKRAREDGDEDYDDDEDQPATKRSRDEESEESEEQ